MVEFKSIPCYETKKWDDTISEFGGCEVFYLNEYVNAFASISSDVPVLLYYNDGITKAMTVMFKRDISKSPYFNNVLEEDKYFDLISPYGYGGLIIEGADKNSVLKAYNVFCLSNRIISEFVRFDLFSGAHQWYDGIVESKTRNIVRSLDIGLDEMKMDFEHKVRKNLKKAERSGLEVIIDRECRFLESFLDIYYLTMQRNGANESFYFPRHFFEFLSKMKNNAIWFYVKKEEKIIATELVLYTKNHCYSYLGGTLYDYFQDRPNELLKYEIIKWAKENGIHDFVLGGGYGEDDGIFQYKKSFAPNGITDFHIGKKIFDEKTYDTLVEIRKREPDYREDTNFFPIYRCNSLNNNLTN